VARAAKALTVDAATAKAQADASNPHASAWVSANAGSGKTYVLAQRVVRLLLAGADPGHILCLTFTRAAAAEMAKRVFDRLAEWTRLDDAALTAKIEELEGRRPDARQLARARRLFATALETPGGLKIQTIHAFCERLLHQFPFEANVPGHFEVLDERDSDALLEEARRTVLAEAARDRSGRLGQALGVVVGIAGDMVVDQSLREFVRERDRLNAWVVRAGSFDAAIAELRSELGLGLGKEDTAEAIRNDICGGTLFGKDGLTRLHGLLKTGGTRDGECAERLAAFFAAEGDDARRNAYLAVWQTKDWKLRAVTSMATNAVKAQWAGLGELLAAERERLEKRIDDWRRADCFETSAAMLTLADAVIAEHQRQKRLRGALDFNDLIIGTANLLKRTDAARWVHYKLDNGLEHILVDEAQDTSPRQWEVVRVLVEEFFAGEGISAAPRTLFAVGDEKQSIFSFQGAVPTRFGLERRHLGSRARGAGLGWSEPALHLSFRSVPTVLDAVDKVFARPEARAGLSSDGEAPVHVAARRNAPGRVVIWPMIPSPEKREPEDWTQPVDHLDEKSPEVQLAERIASTVARWKNSRERIEATGEPVTPKSILVLSRIRGAQTDAINRALKGKGIAIAGADRLAITDHIAVMDLIALGRVVLLPEDDLSLAALLKSPLLGLGEDELYEIAYQRPHTLFDALGLAASTKGGVFGAAFERLNGWRKLADYLDPHAFFARVLGPDGGRRQLLARLGNEAEDVLDEFLGEALAYERSHAPSLEGFLAFLTGTRTEVRRDPDDRRDEVRVMTVHGAKGLEADIVFLVDTGAAPANAAHDPRVLALRDDRDGTVAPLVWMRGAKGMPEMVKARVEALREQAREEYRRLLYVGMTRAKDRLYVVGTEKQIGKENARIWHTLVREALADELTEVMTPEGEELEWRAVERKAVAAKGEQRDLPLIDPLPAWIRAPVSPPPAAPQRITPSTALAGTAGPDFPRPLIAARGDADAATALERGRVVHRLLQSLPEIAPEHRAATAGRYLASVLPDWSELDRAEVAGGVLAVLDDPLFAAVFAPGSRAEVDVAGRVELGGKAFAVSGRIDRLAVLPERVLIVDYKTNRPPPAELEDVPAAYVGQLALYRLLLARLYPQKRVEAALLWTEVPALMDVPAEAMDAALAAMTET
jgi:ATP-dependent helicase/nuclease subunit A